MDGPGWHSEPPAPRDEDPGDHGSEEHWVCGARVGRGAELWAARTGGQRP